MKNKQNSFGFCMTNSHKYLKVTSTTTTELTPRIEPVNCWVSLENLTSPTQLQPRKPCVTWVELQSVGQLA